MSVLHKNCGSFYINFNSLDLFRSVNRFNSDITKVAKVSKIDTSLCINDIYIEETLLSLDKIDNDYIKNGQYIIEICTEGKSDDEYEYYLAKLQNDQFYPLYRVFKEDIKDSNNNFYVLFRGQP